MATFIESTISRCITLASSTTVYNLHTLLQAINTNYPRMVKSLRLAVRLDTADGYIYVGDASMTGSSDVGWVLARQTGGGIVVFEELALDGTFNNIDLAAFNLRPSADNTQLQVFAKVE